MTVMPMRKSWDIDPNNLGGTGSTTTQDHQATLYAIKEALIGGGSGELTAPMTVSLSSDGAEAGASDFWLDSLDLVWGTGAHSWIVLKMGSGTAEICFDLDSTVARQMKPLWSPGGLFTGGDTSNRPTATDEQPISNTSGAVGFMGNNSGSARYVVHVWGSTDGESYRVAVFHEVGNCSAFMMFEKMAEPSEAAGAVPFNGYVMEMTSPSSSTGHCLRTDGLNGFNDSTKTRIEFDGAEYAAQMCVEGRGASYTAMSPSNGTADAVADIRSPNEISDQWLLSPLAIYCDTSGARGRHGVLNDVWLVPSDNGNPPRAGRGDGDTFPESDDSDGARQVVVLGYIALPWGLDLDLQLGNWEA